LNVDSTTQNELPSAADVTAPIDDDIPARYDWAYVLGIALRHRRELIIAHVVALCAALVSVPIPLLMPLLVDEVLLGHPGVALATLQSAFPEEWWGPVTWIMTMLALTVGLRLGAMVLTVWQSRQFTFIAKDITYRLRSQMLGRLERISLAEYETLGSGAVAAHFVTDLESIDQFVGSTVARFVVAVLRWSGARSCSANGSRSSNGARTAPSSCFRTR